MSGSAAWKEVLSVYAVKIAGDPNDPQEVVSMAENKKQILTDIFWAMNVITYSTETKTENVVTETDDGNIVQTYTTLTKTYLYVTVLHKTMGEIVDEYKFNEEQKECLAELLHEKNKSLWKHIILDF